MKHIACVHFIFFALPYPSGKDPLMAFIYSWLYHRLSSMLSVCQRNMICWTALATAREKLRIPSSVRLRALNVMIKCNEASNVKLKTVPIFSEMKFWIEFSQKNIVYLEWIPFQCWVWSICHDRSICKRLIYRLRDEFFRSNIWRLLWYSKHHFSKTTKFTNIFRIQEAIKQI